MKTKARYTDRMIAGDEYMNRTTKQTAARIGLRLDAQLRRRIEADARADHLKISDIVRRIVRRHYEGAR